MDPVMLHLLDSMHTWLSVVAFAALVAAAAALVAWVNCESEDEPPKLHFACAVIVLAAAATLAIFLPTTNSMRAVRDAIADEQEALKASAKRAYCIQNPGRCK